MKIRPVGAELFHVDRQTDMTRLHVVVAFRKFADTLKKENPSAICKDGYSFVLSVSVGEPVRL